MAARVVVVAGPAASGKTRQLLQAHRAALASRQPGVALWLAPTARGAGAIRQQIISPDLPACFSPGVSTFEQFAESVVRFAATPVRPLTPLLKRRLLESIVSAAAEQGELRYFAAIADMPGFIDQLDQFIADLKRQEVWPDDFAKACRGKRMRDKDRELAAIYVAYQERLRDHQLYDAQGRFWTARELLHGGQRRPYDRLRRVTADGFTDFTRTQREILDLLTQWIDELWISLPLEGELRRADCFRKSHDTLDHLRTLFPQLEVVWTERRAEPLPAALRRLEEQIFLPPAAQSSIEPGSEVVITAAASEVRELECVARDVKRLLLGDGQQPPVAPGDIAVVFRQLPPVADLAREIFTRIGVPVAIDARETLNRSPAVRALLGLLRLDSQDWPYRQVIAALGSSYYQLASDEPASDRLLADVEWLIHDLQVLSGRAELLDRVGRQAQRDIDELPPPSGDNPESGARVRRRILTARRCAPALIELARRIDALPADATPSQWAKALNHFARDIGMDAKLQDADGARDRAALRRLCEALEDEDRLANQLGQAPPRFDRAELIDWLTETASREEIPLSIDDTGRVRVLGAAAARAVRVRHLFLAGMSEESYPHRRSSGICQDADIDRLRDAKIRLQTAAEFDDEEMLLFYELVTRADESLHLSYAALDDRARPLLPSPYLDEVSRLVGAAARRDATDPRPVYDLDQPPLCVADARCASVHRLVEDGDDQLLASVLQSGAESGMAAGLVAVQNRRGRDYGPFEGLFDSVAIARRLASQFDESRVWSASQLEQYATCPFQFLLDRVLKLEPLPPLGIEVDLAQRGLWLHAALARLHSRLNQEHNGPYQPTEADEERIAEYLRDALRDIAAAADYGAELEKGLRDITLGTLLRWAERYPRQCIDLKSFGIGDQPAPAHFEVSFGLAKKSDDPASTTEPLILRHDGQSLSISGRIDRVDLGEHAGVPVFRIIDYKSGNPPTAKDHAAVDGTTLQLDLYTLAARQIFPAALPGSMGYWQVKGKGYQQIAELVTIEDGDLVIDPGWIEQMEQLTQKLFELVAGIRKGQFPVHSLNDKCTSYCDYRTVCRVGQTRALEKAWPPTPKP
ncbi:MAG: exodeoxyribonuclease V subunit gamma [Pirellulales bacterium]|nr:exodeoxyribonuclease V subunit gamma [Pirellulales bacterium]